MCTSVKRLWPWCCAPEHHRLRSGMIRECVKGPLISLCWSNFRLKISINFCSSLRRTYGSPAIHYPGCLRHVLDWFTRPYGPLFSRSTHSFLYCSFFWLICSMKKASKSTKKSDSCPAVSFTAPVVSSCSLSSVTPDPPPPSIGIVPCMTKNGSIQRAWQCIVQNWTDKMTKFSP